MSDFALVSDSSEEGGVAIESSGGRPGRRNPTWTTDELILAMDLYLRKGLLDDRDPEVVELSRVLNALPIHGDKGTGGTFRNPNGIALKLANFASLDESYSGKGMERGGRRDREVWGRFKEARSELSNLATLLRVGASGSVQFPSTPEPDEFEVQEGALAYRRHCHRERDRRIVERKKAQVLESGGRLACEVCDFSFEDAYGALGARYIECHHVRPLAESGPTTTALRDLALLCANCHRMIHRLKPWPTIAGFKTTGLVVPRSQLGSG